MLSTLPTEIISEIASFSSSEAPLIWAARNGYESFVTDLIDDSNDDDIYRASMAACSEGHLHILQLFVDGGMELSHHHLNAALMTDLPIMVDYVLSIDPSLMSKHHLINVVNCGKLNALSMMIEHGGDVNTVNPDTHECLLTYAIKKSNLPIVQLLIDEEAIIGYGDLEEACMYSDSKEGLNVLSCLLKARKWEQEELDTCIEFAAEYGGDDAIALFFCAEV